MKVTISKGNVKLGKIPNISLPPIISCRPGVPCAKDCYATKAYRMYPNVRKAWDGNLAMYNSDPEEYFMQIQSWLKRNKPEWFRWHVSGEILDEWYWGMVRNTAEAFKGTKFLIFTKYFELNFTHVPDNLSAVLSMWPGMKVPEINLPRAWCQDGTESRMPWSAIECPGNCQTCSACWGLAKRGWDVVFAIH